jgi:hypothetical protein
MVFSEMDKVIYGRPAAQAVAEARTDVAADLRPVHGIELAQNLPRI